MHDSASHFQFCLIHTYWHSPRNLVGTHCIDIYFCQLITHFLVCVCVFQDIFTTCLQRWHLTDTHLWNSLTILFPARLHTYPPPHPNLWVPYSTYLSIIFLTVRCRALCSHSASVSTKCDFNILCDSIQFASLVWHSKLCITKSLHPRAAPAVGFSSLPHLFLLPVVLKNIKG